METALTHSGDCGQEDGGQENDCRGVARAVPRHAGDHHNTTELFLKIRSSRDLAVFSGFLRVF